MRRLSTAVARFPVALVLTIGYLWTAMLLAFDWPVGDNEHLKHFRWIIVAGSIVFAAWHLLGYLGFIADGPRKIGYLLSGAWVAGFAALLWSDHARLAGGYALIAAALALISYWKYPRRHEVVEEEHLEHGGG